MKLLPNSENITLTEDWTDIGDIIGPDTMDVANKTGDSVIDYTTLLVGVFLTLNDSTDFQIRAKTVDDEDPNDRLNFPAETRKKDITRVRRSFQEFDEDISTADDDGQCFIFGLAMAVDAVQLQVRVKAGSLGATAGVVDKIKYNLGFVQ